MPAGEVTRRRTKTPDITWDPGQTASTPPADHRHVNEPRKDLQGNPNQPRNHEPHSIINVSGHDALGRS